MRIIAGAFKGRRLTPPKDDKTRPTSDRTREALFNLLMHGELAGGCVIDQTILDLCCGTGALGLEALSRGASKAIMIDSSKQVLALAQKNAHHCNAFKECQFIEASLPNLPAAKEPVSLVLFDAPYGSGLIAPTVKKLLSGNWLQPSAILSIEHGGEELKLEGLPLEVITERRYGKAYITVLRLC